MGFTQAQPLAPNLAEHSNSRAATFGIGEGLSEEVVAASTQALATAVLDQGGISEDASLMRAAAQMYACAACIGTNSAATQLTQSVCKDMAQTPVPARSLPVHYPFDAVCVFATGLCATVQCQVQNYCAAMLGNLALLK